MQFEQFSPEDFVGYRQVPPRIRINSLGTLTINATGLRLAGWGDQTEAVLLSFDPTRQVIGLQAATLDTPDAIPLRKQNRTKTCGVSAFCKKYGLLPPERSINIELEYNSEVEMLLANYGNHRASTRKAKELAAAAAKQETESETV